MCDTVGDAMYSVIIPVYKNEEFIPLLTSEFSRIYDVILDKYNVITEFVFVVDASPDSSYLELCQKLPQQKFPSQLVLHTRNFGSIPAMRTGLEAARGIYFGTIAADLQEPPELLVEFLVPLLNDEADVVVGRRLSREDPFFTRLMANVFWSFYRKAVNADIPPGGVDIFACSKTVRDNLLTLKESHSTLVGLLYWLGYRRCEIFYHRRKRLYGQSAWTVRKKITYFLDSVFAFTDLPIRMLTALGAFGLFCGFIYSAIIVVLSIAGQISVPGYAATILIVIFFGSLNTLGLGIVGVYAWRANENAKRRPTSVVQKRDIFLGGGSVSK